MITTGLLYAIKFSSKISQSFLISRDHWPTTSATAPDRTAPRGPGSPCVTTLARSWTALDCCDPSQRFRSCTNPISNQTMNNPKTGKMKCTLDLTGARDSEMVEDQRCARGMGCGVHPSGEVAKRPPSKVSPSQTINKRAKTTKEQTKMEIVIMWGAHLIKICLTRFEFWVIQSLMAAFVAFRTALSAHVIDRSSSRPVHPKINFKKVLERCDRQMNEIEFWKGDE